MRTRDAVAIERRAAEIAAAMIDSLSHDMTGPELAGWMRAGDKRERGSYPKDKHWQAGWLAAHVWHESHMEPYSAWARDLDMSKLPTLSKRGKG